MVRQFKNVLMNISKENSMTIDTSDTLYSVSSWKTDNFMFREYDRTYNCAWESKCMVAYDIIKQEYDKLVEESKLFNKGLIDMKVVMKKEYCKSTFPSRTFPDTAEVLFEFDSYRLEKEND